MAESALILFVASQLAIGFAARVELQLHDHVAHHVALAAPMSIEDFKKGWEEKGVPVVQLDSLDDFKDHFADEPWKSPVDIRGPSTDTPLSGAVPLHNVIDTTFLYHGGNIRTAWFGGGVSSIDFNKSFDQVSGSTFFTTHNAFFASFYGTMGTNSVKEANGDGELSDTGYAQMLQLELSQPDQCFGLVPDWSFLEELAKLDLQHKEAKVQEACGSDCSFIAVNWNKDGTAGGGVIPYEFRLLPASIQKCGVKFSKVFAIKYDSATQEFINSLRPAFAKAGRIFEHLISLNKANFNQKKYGEKFASMD